MGIKTGNELSLDTSSILAHYDNTLSVLNILIIKLKIWLRTKKYFVLEYATIGNFFLSLFSIEFYSYFQNCVSFQFS
jgi:hypothetical protein